MKTVSLYFNLLFFIVSLNIHAQTKASRKNKAASVSVPDQKIKFKISGTVNVTTPYCGGAAPSEEIMENSRKPQPYNAKVFYVRKGNINSMKAEIILSFTTNTKGEFVIELPEGTYSIIQKEQTVAFKMKDYKMDKFHIAEESCLKEWWGKPYHVLDIKDKNIEGLIFTFHRQCFVTSDIPCIRYIGPMPP